MQFPFKSVYIELTFEPFLLAIAYEVQKYNQNILNFLLNRNSYKG